MAGLQEMAESEIGTRVVDVEVPPEGEGTRLDVFLVSVAGLSRNQIQSLIKEGEVRMNGEVEMRPGCRLQGGEKIMLRIPPPRPSNLKAEPLGLDVIYQDSDVGIINKPSGVIVHPSEGIRTGTLVNAMLYHLTDLSGIGGKLRPGIVHRLDKETSGVLVVAKNNRAHRGLADQFKQHTVKKEYLALVYGSCGEEEFEVNAPIARHPRDRKRMAVVRSGKEAITFFKVEARWRTFVLFRAFPRTGRTHQIRVHLAHRHLPIVGDTVYGYRNRGVLRTGLSLLCNRRGGFYLHAHRITLDHPRTGETMTFEAPLEPVFVETIEALDRTLGREE
jgi:23S rRNA pseudouridine1911/1915/1917 synthase